METPFNGGEKWWVGLWHFISVYTSCKFTGTREKEKRENREYVALETAVIYYYDLPWNFPSEIGKKKPKNISDNILSLIHFTFHTVSGSAIYMVEIINYYNFWQPTFLNLFAVKI